MAAAVAAGEVPGVCRGRAVATRLPSHAAVRGATRGAAPGGGTHGAGAGSDVSWCDLGSSRRAASPGRVLMATGASPLASGDSSTRCAGLEAGCPAPYRKKATEM